MDPTKVYSRFWCCIVVVWLSMTSRAQAKVVSGKAQLSGAASESTISKFSFSARSRPTIKGTFESSRMYVDERNLKLYLYVDDDWKAVKKAATCRDKVRLAQQSYPLKFEMKPASGNKELWSAKIDITLESQSRSKRPKYWYITIADCSLEQWNHDKDAPEMQFTVTIMDEFPAGSYTHLPSDEQGMQALQLFNIVLGCLLFAALILRGLVLLKQRNEIHLSLLVLLVACSMNVMASFCEMIHLQAYRRNGIGSYTFDALSAHLEALTDACISILLLAVAVGWTLPSDIALRVDDHTFNTTMIKWVQRLRSPTSSRSGIFCLLLIGAHSGLAQWGRIYDDDFDCYHDLEHLPGQILFLLRAFLGLLMMLGVASLQRTCSPNLARFLHKFGLIGLAWFVSLPAIAITSSHLVPSYRRHQVVSLWSTLVQFTSLTSLAWLFTGPSQASAFHKVSRVGGASQDTLDTRVSSKHQVAFSMGKSKIRID